MIWGWVLSEPRSSPPPSASASTVRQNGSVQQGSPVSSKVEAAARAIFAGSQCDSGQVASTFFMASTDTPTVGIHTTRPAPFSSTAYRGS